jgi:signal transduction histidine kinase
MEYINPIIPIEVIIFNGVSTLVLGIYIYIFAYKLSNSHYISAKYISYVCFAIFNWIFWIIIQNKYIFPLENIWLIYIANVIIYFSFISIIQSLIFFAISFNDTRLSKKYNFLIYPYILTVFLILIPKIGILQLNMENPIAYQSIAYYILLLYSISYLILYMKILTNKYNSTHNQKIKKSIKFFLTLTSISIFMVLITNIIIPSILSNTASIYYGPVFMLIFVLTVLVSIFKYKLIYISTPVDKLVITLMITLILFLMRFSIIDNNILHQLQANIVFTFIFSWIYIFLTREVYIGFKNQILLNNKKRELEVVLASKNSFLQNSSHQFRTPLTVILGYLGMIVNKENPKYELNNTTKDDLNKAYISAKNLNDIINDVLTVNDVNAGKFGVDIKDNIDLKQLINSIIYEKKELLSDKNTNVNLIVKGNQSTVKIDSNKVKEAINNIFDNAIFYGKGQIDILINYEINDFFEISIKDNGVGITASDAKKIWKKFERGKKSPQINPNGSGLGLYLAKQIIVQHGGEINVESEGLNKGSSFIIRIPKTQSYNNK